MEGLAQTWLRLFPGTPPCGYLLRERVGQRSTWLRLHSLPGSKRYADSVDEREELLARHRDVGTELLGKGSRCLLYLQAYEEDGSLFPTRAPWAGRLKLCACPELTFPRAELEGPDLTFFAALVDWPGDAITDLLWDVAEDRSGCVTFLNPESGEVYAPYDGGMDLFLANARRRGSLRTRWKSWLSAHPKGL